MIRLRNISRFQEILSQRLVFTPSATISMLLGSGRYMWGQTGWYNTLHNILQISSERIWTILVNASHGLVSCDCTNVDSRGSAGKVDANFAHQLLISFIILYSTNWC